MFFFFLAANFVLIYLYLLWHTRASRFFSPCPFCYLVRVIEFWRYCVRCVFLSCQPVKVVGRPARNTELSRGVTLEIDRSPDASRIYAYIAYVCRDVGAGRFLQLLQAGRIDQRCAMLCIVLRHYNIVKDYIL